MKWEKAQAWELRWWDNCANTFGEEMKQLLYAGKMGLLFTPDAKTPWRIDMEGKSVLDIGGGPASLLLKYVNVKGKVIDSLEFPKWVLERYQLAGVEFERIKAEDMNTKEKFDECLIYNVLQHTEDPGLIIKNVKRVSKIIRLFEWIDTPANIGHPHSLTEQKLNSWLGGEGRVEELKNQSQCSGRAYYGVFKGERYD